MSKFVKSRDGLVSCLDAGRMLGIPRQTLALLAERLGIVAKAVEGNPNTKGLDAADLRRIRDAWERATAPGPALHR